MPALAGTIRFGPGYWPPPPHTPGYPASEVAERAVHG